MGVHMTQENTVETVVSCLLVHKSKILAKKWKAMCKKQRVRRKVWRSKNLQPANMLDDQENSLVYKKKLCLFSSGSLSPAHSSRLPWTMWYKSQQNKRVLLICTSAPPSLDLLPDKCPASDEDLGMRWGKEANHKEKIFIYSILKISVVTPHCLLQRRWQLFLVL